MTTNVGSLDRMIRLLLGVVLIAAPFVTGLAIFASGLVTVISVIVGLVLLFTAITRSCLIYTALGLRTCKA